PGPRLRTRHETIRIEIDRRDDGLLRAVRPEMAHERAGVDAGDPDDAVVAHVVAEALLGAPVARRVPVLLDDEALHERLARLDVLAVHTDVTDLGIRHRDEL